VTYAFVVSGGSLPPGLSLSADGVLAGTPTAEGYFYFTIMATDAHGLTGRQWYGLSISAVDARGKKGFRSYSLTIRPPFLEFPFANG
jgi:hypothetical protein